jgi:arylsulfatase A-like enzyme
MPERRPNLIFILTDDQRHDALGCAGNELIRTPNMDSLAERGVLFRNAFVTLSICSPSRACCLTGRYGSANGVATLGAKLKPGERTFAQYLKQAGYQTCFVGKWHIGGSTPADVGFDDVVYFTSNGPQHDREVIERGRQTTAKGYIEDYCADQCVRFMESAAKQEAPFLLHLCTQVPHMTPEYTWEAKPETLARYGEATMPVPESWDDDLAGKPPYLREARFRTRAQDIYGYRDPAAIRRHTRLYYAAITDLDEALGRAIAAVDALGMRENTYVLLMGDNGWFMGEHGLTSKVLAYEESIRVPLVVSGPGLTGEVNDELVINADIAPTLLDLAGAPVAANVHGSSLVPLLRGQQTDWRSSFLYEAPIPALGSWPLFAVRTREWKYIQTYDPEDRSGPAFEELYDLRDDPHEMTNLAGLEEHGETQARLEAELAELRARAEAG